jgi:hypothetical protein
MARSRASSVPVGFTTFRRRDLDHTHVHAEVTDLESQCFVMISVARLLAPNTEPRGSFGLDFRGPAHRPYRLVGPHDLDREQRDEML